MTESKLNTGLVFQSSTKAHNINLKRQSLKASRPVVLCHDVPPGTALSFVDIAHSLATIDIVNSKYNQFSALVDTANDWLQKNYMWKVLSCETVSLVFKKEKLDPFDFGATKRLLQSNINFDLSETIILKSLRLWVQHRDDVPEMKKNIEIQFISYLTFLPKSCQYYQNQIGWEQLDDVIDDINDAIKSGEIKGKLLNIESINYDANEDWEVDTEYPKQKEFTSKQETALRVFYSNTPSVPEEIAIFDFIPDIVSTDSPPKFEPFSSLLYKAQEFLEDNQHCKFLCLQSLDIKFKRLDEIHTYFMVHINDIGYYLRILRLVCTKAYIPTNIRRLEKQLSFEDLNQNDIMSKTEVDEPELFQPKANNSTEMSDSSMEATVSTDNCQKRVINIESRHFEIKHNNTLHGPFYPVKRAIEEFMEREEWNEDRLHKWRYLFAETVVVLAKDESDILKKIENSLYSNRHNVLAMPRIYYLIRLYFDTALDLERKVSKFSKTKSISIEKDLRRFSLRQSLRKNATPENAVQVVDTTVKPTNNKVTRSTTCSLL